MKILFVHQNFPGQFPHLAPALRDRGHQVMALTAETNKRASPVEVVKYRKPEPVTLSSPLTKLYAEVSERGLKAALAAKQLRDKYNYVPDVIFGHSGWGETLYLKEVWPEAKLLVYAELMYRSEGLDTDFDPEFRREGLGPKLSTVARSAHLMQAMIQADAGVSPTQFQADTFPPELRSKISVIFDGVDTDVMAPDPDARLSLLGGDLVFKPGDEVLTFVNRSLEPYRGYHSFMRALPAVMAARPKAHVVIVGEEGQSYGPAPAQGSWKQIFLDEVESRLDMSRLHFLGRVPYSTFTALLQVSRCHCYLTYPFVLSWSLMESMAAGAVVVASDTAPVREMIVDGENGKLVDFFNHAALADAMIDALANPQAYESMRKNARQTIVDGYDLKSICLPRLVEFVESAVSG
ncbi:glycosyltransferase [Albirhodobacter sp. R86504]|uniref:glycosyltransferase n=1 Tax=Albirhodobacter sp. R86504 TaxID=3093848 RepID=UPI00366EDB95